MRVTINVINRELKKRGHDVALQRGRGYFYFSGGYLYDSSVMVYRLSALSVEEWVAEFERRLAETNKGRFDPPKGNLFPGNSFPWSGGKETQCK